MAKILIEQELCKGCNLCIKMCPKGVFKETDEIGSGGFKLKEVAFPEKCSSCGLCEYYCCGAINLVKSREAGIPPSAELFNRVNPGEVLNSPVRVIKDKKPRGGWREVKSHFASGRHFIDGNEAIVWGAVDAGCLFFSGYPISPANKILKRMVEIMEEIGGVADQSEDEIAAIFEAIGGSWAGKKSMTATSGPGFSLMPEGLSHMDMTETPGVIVDVQRAGPSTGQPTKPAAMDMREVRHGSHGGIQRIVLYPGSVQEAYDLTIKAFNLSEMFRVPVIILSDGYLANLSETLEIQEKIRLFDRIYIPGQPPFGPTPDYSTPSMPCFGDSENLSITGSTHDQWGNRSTSDPNIQEKLVWHLQNKILKHRQGLIDAEELFLEDAKVAVVAFGTVGRSAKWAVLEARKKGIKAGLFRPRIIYPFPTNRMKELSKTVDKFVVPEMNQGQMFYVVREKISNEVVSLAQPNGQIIGPRRILKYLTEEVW